MSVPRRPVAPRAGAGRRAALGAVWALAWTLVWGGALMLFAGRAHAAPPALAAAAGPVSRPAADVRAPLPARPDGAVGSPR